MRVEQTKVCTKCGNEKPLEAFSTATRCKDGKQPWCKVCLAKCNKQRSVLPEVRASKAAQQRERRLDMEFRNKENQRTREWRKANPGFKDEQREYWREFYSDEQKQTERKERARKNRTDIHVRARALLAGAKQRDPQCSMTLEHVLAGIQRGHCPVTGILFDLTSDHQRVTGRSRNPYSPSVDRIDNRVGYTNENTRVVITHYNFMKGQLTDDEMKYICARVAGVPL